MDKLGFAAFLCVVAIIAALTLKPDQRPTYTVTHDTPPPERFTIPNDKSLYGIRKGTAKKIPIYMIGYHWGDFINGILPGAISCQISKDFAQFITTIDTDETQEKDDEPYWLELQESETNADILAIDCNAIGAETFRLLISTIH